MTLGKKRLRTSAVYSTCRVTSLRVRVPTRPALVSRIPRPLTLTKCFLCIHVRFGVGDAESTTHRKCRSGPAVAVHVVSSSLSQSCCWLVQYVFPTCVNTCFQTNNRGSWLIVWWKNRNNESFVISYDQHSISIVSLIWMKYCIEIYKYCCIRLSAWKCKSTSSNKECMKV